MKSRIFVALATASIVGLTLTGCTGAPKPPVAESSPVTAPAAEQTPSRFADHQKALDKLAPGAKIVAQAKSTGPATIKLPDALNKEDTIGFLITCTSNMPWEIEYTGTKVGASECNEAPQSASVSEMPVKQLKGDSVKLLVGGKVESWVTVYTKAPDDE